MKEELSAGGIIVCRVKNEWYVLLMRDMNGVLTFPKGIIEPGEDPQAASLREIREEVGIGNLKLLRLLTTIEYYYRRKGTIRKRVIYYLYLSKRRHKPVVQKEEGIQEALWMPIGEAVLSVGYAETNRPILQRARRWMLRKLTKSI